MYNYTANKISVIAIGYTFVAPYNTPIQSMPQWHHKMLIDALRGCTINVWVAPPAVRNILSVDRSVRCRKLLYSWTFSSRWSSVQFKFKLASYRWKEFIYWRNAKIHNLLIKIFSAQNKYNTCRSRNDILNKIQSVHYIQYYAQYNKWTDSKWSFRPRMLVSLSPRPRMLVSLSPRPRMLVSLSQRPRMLVSLSHRPRMLVSLSPSPRMLVSLRPRPRMLVSPGHALHGTQPLHWHCCYRKKKFSTLSTGRTWTYCKHIKHKYICSWV